MKDWKYLKYWIVWSVASLLLITSCEEDQVESLDHLEQVGILGQWKLDNRSVNGIANLAVESCDSLHFDADSEPTDWKGMFRASGNGYARTGDFELDTLNRTIAFSYEDVLKWYSIQLTHNSIRFNYLENQDQIEEYWIKLE